MDSLEADSQSFIVKVWIEDSALQSHRSVWRGHITHVPSRQRRYLKDLDEISDFIAPHLEAMGVKLSAYWQLRHWLKRLMSRS